MNSIRRRTLGRRVRKPHIVVGTVESIVVHLEAHSIDRWAYASRDVIIYALLTSLKGRGTGRKQNQIRVIPLQRQVDDFFMLNVLTQGCIGRIHGERGRRHLHGLRDRPHHQRYIRGKCFVHLKHDTGEKIRLEACLCRLE